MNKKIDEFLDKVNIDVDEIKGEIQSVIDDEINKVKVELKEKMEDKFSDEGQKKIIQKINDAVDIPFISEKTEGKAIASMLNIVEDVVKALLLKKL